MAIEEQYFKERKKAALEKKIAEQKQAKEQKERDDEKSADDKAKAREEKEQLKIKRIQLSAEAKGISEEEQIRQDKFDFSVKAKKRMIASELKKSGGVETKKTKAMNKSLQEEEKVEKERREGQSTTLLEKIANNTKGLGKGIKDFVGKTPAGLKAILAGVAFFALAKFLQSDKWKEIVSFIVDNIVPALKEFYDDIMKFDFTLTGENGLLALIKDNFLVLLGALAILKPKLVFNLVKMVLSGIYKSLLFMATDLQKNPFSGKRFHKVRRALMLLKLGFKSVLANILVAAKSMLANPIGLAIAAVVAVFALVVYYWDDIKKKMDELGGVAGIFARVVANVKDALSSVANKLIKAYNFLTNSDVELFDTGRAKKVNERIEDDIQKKNFKDQYSMSQGEMYKKFQDGMKGQEENAKIAAEASVSIDEKTEKKKPLSFEEMTAASLTKLVGLMDGKGTNITTIQNDNSQNNNSQNNTHTSTPVGDPSYPQQVAT
jgi:hypothetical protein